MKKKLLSFALALVMCLGLLPTAAFAANSINTNLPDWYFLFAIFKNVDADVTDKDGQTTHIKYSMSQDEIDYAKKEAEDFEAAMNSLGVMRAHMDVVEIDTPITEKPKVNGVESYVTAKQAAALLKNKVALDHYDFVFCATDLNVNIGYSAITTNEYENGAGHTCINYWSWNNWSPARMPGGLLVHEFLHFMECMSARWGQNFELHKIGDFYEKTYGSSLYVTVNPLIDIIMNRAKGEFGTGVNPAVWQNPPHIAWATHEWTFPSSVTNIGSWAFLDCVALTKVTIPANITKIGGGAFQGCTNLSEVTILPGAASIGNQAFNKCTKLTKITIPSSITKIGQIAFYNTGLKDVYYEGTEAQWKAIEIGEYNGALTNAKIHYNSVIKEPGTTKPAQSVKFTDVPASAYYYTPVQWAVAQGVTAGTSATAFSPNQTCTQGQILTFLWRAKGSPAPSGAVSGKEYYAAAVQWAKEQGIVAGTLAPNSPCTRADVVTYLWKLAGSPKTGTSDFTDVPATADCARAVAWAVEQGVTAGTSATTFSPDQTCTRGQIVTFLHRALVQ